MACYLAPEGPRPSSVTSENYFRQLNSLNGLPIVNYDKNRCLFGEEYEREFCFYLATHIEVNATDKYCLIGEESQWAFIIQEQLFLNKTVYFVDCNSHHDEIKKQVSPNKFDRIILLNCLHKINPSFINLFYKSLTKYGRLLIIYREPKTTTLPLPIQVLPNWFREHAKSSRFIEQIYRDKKSNIEIISEKVETIKFRMNKLHWFRLIYNQMFYPLILINQQQIIDGLRRMNETYFKYHQGLVEMYDNLLFLTIQNKTDLLLPRPTTRQINAILSKKISLANEITELLNLREQYTKQDLYKSSIQFT